MAALTDTDTLANGLEIPKLGFGTWLIDNEDAARAVRDAIDIGYRHIDTAQGYRNEQGVGEGIRSSGIVPWIAGPATPAIRCWWVSSRVG